MWKYQPKFAEILIFSMRYTLISFIQWVLMWLFLIIQIIGVNYSNTIDELSGKDTGFVPSDCCLWYWDDGFVLQFLFSRNNQDVKKELWISELLGSQEALCWVLYPGKTASFILYKSVNKGTKLWLMNDFVSLEIMYVLQGCIMIICWHAVLDINPGNKQKDTFLNIASFILYLNATVV